MVRIIVIFQHLIVLRDFDIMYSLPAQNCLSSFGPG